MRRRAGIALVNVLMIATITTLLLIAGIQFIHGSLKEGRNADFEQQAYQVALAGINHSLMWLQVHRGEAPTVFDPRVVPTEPDIPAETTTAYEQFGVVQEYEIDATKKLWGRYEVARSQEAPIRDTLSQMGPHLSLYTDPITWSVDDAGRQRGSTIGSIWQARSRGYLFTRANPTDPFTLTNPKPVRAITLEGELKNVVIGAPRAAIYSFKDGTDTGSPHINFTYAGTASAGNTAISNGGDTGALHLWANTATANITQAANVAWEGGTYGEAVGCTDSAASNYVDPDLTSQMRQVFGASNAEAVEGLADASYTAAGSIGTLTDMKFIYLNPGDNRGTATFDAGTRLRGQGVLFVDGSLEIKGTSAASHYWQGLIFVTGHYSQTGNSTVTGSIMAGETITIGGDDSSQAKVIYSQDALNRVSDRFSGFRLDRSTLKVIDDSGTTY